MTKEKFGIGIIPGSSGKKEILVPTKVFCIFYWKVIG